MILCLINVLILLRIILYLSSKISYEYGGNVLQTERLHFKLINTNPKTLINNDDVDTFGNFIQDSLKN